MDRPPQPRPRQAQSRMALAPGTVRCDEPARRHQSRLDRRESVRRDATSDEHDPCDLRVPEQNVEQEEGIRVGPCQNGRVGRSLDVGWELAVLRDPREVERLAGARKDADTRREDKYCASAANPSPGDADGQEREPGCPDPPADLGAERELRETVDRRRVMVDRREQWLRHGQDDGRERTDIRHRHVGRAARSRLFCPPDERQGKEWRAVKCETFVDTIVVRSPQRGLEQHSGDQGGGQQGKRAAAWIAGPAKAAQSHDRPRHEHPACRDRQHERVDHQPRADGDERIGLVSHGTDEHLDVPALPAYEQECQRRR